jgi:chromosome segregation ATPase
MQHLQSLSLLEERIQAAVELIASLRNERKRLEADALRLVDDRRALERQIDLMKLEKEDMTSQSFDLAKTGEALRNECEALRVECATLRARQEELRAKQDEFQRFEQDRDEIRARIDGMLAKFEELEV